MHRLGSTAVFCFLAPFCLCQTATDAPLQLQSPATDARAATITNVSSRPVVGYVLLVKTPTGASMDEVRLIGMGPDRRSFRPGETWPHKFRTSLPADASLAIDYVLYADGKGWGPNQAGKAEYLRGLCEGFTASQAYFKRLFQEKGASGVAAHLETIP